MKARMYRLTPVALLAMAALAACGPTAPEMDEPRITLAVSGGFAGVDWQFTIDGQRGEIIGDRCAARMLCDWDAGQMLGVFDGNELSRLAEDFQNSGFFEGPVDYGTQCCDQFVYALSYSDGTGTRTVRGSQAEIPEEIAALVRLVEEFVSEART